MARIQHFSALTGGLHSAIFFLPQSQNSSPQRMPLNEVATPLPHPLQPFQDLQLSLVRSNTFIPCFYLATPGSVSGVLKVLTTSISLEASNTGPEIPNAGRDLLPYCAIDGPMDQATFTAVSDMFPSLRHLAGLEDGKVGAKRMGMAGIGEQNGEDCLSYWREEWVIE